MIHLTINIIIRLPVAMSSITDDIEGTCVGVYKQWPKGRKCGAARCTH